MNKTEITFLEILSAFVNERKPDIDASADVPRLYNLAKSQSVAGIVSYVLHKWGRDDLLTQDKRLNEAYDKTVAQFIRKDIESQKLFSMLTKAQIPHIIFKGTVIKECYPVPELRTFGDVDVIIHSRDRKKSDELMVNNGYSREVMDSGAVYGYKKGKEFYEIHTSLNSERTKMSDYLRDYWSYTALRSGLTYEFELNFHFAYLISHIEKHVYCSNAGVRLYLDIALFLKKHASELDADKIHGILKDCNLDKFYNTVLYLCSRWFNSEKLYNEELTAAQYDSFCKFTLRGGTFGSVDSGADSEVRRAISSKGKISKLRLVLRHIFPTYKEARRMYPFVNGRPYLLPLSWVIHPFAAAKRSGLKNIKRVASANVDEAKNERELLRQIGSWR